MKPIHALILVGAAVGVYYASTLDTETDDNGEGGGFLGWLPDEIRQPIESGWGFIKVGAENVYGETFGYWDMKPSPQIIEFIKKHEGVRYQAYETKKGNGDWTIGIGHKLIGDELTTLRGVTISDAKVSELLDGDLNRKAGAPLWREGAAATVRRLLKVEVSQPQFDALVSFVFNFGAGSKDKPITPNLFALVNAERHTEAANYIQSAGSAQWVGMSGLKERRSMESALYRSGIND